ncbi:MAG: VanZ family protein [Myxococcota bacterium]|nr:VanZ family protein [Myxococcota bacterium]
MSRESALRIALAWLPAFLYMALIWALSSMSTIDLPIDEFPFRDKGIHAVEYLILGFLVTHAALRSWPERSRARLAAVALLVTCGWGVLDEIHQAFVPGRSPDLLDLVADLIGALIGSTSRLALAAMRGRRATSERTVSQPKGVT